MKAAFTREKNKAKVYKNTKVEMSMKENERMIRSRGLASTNRRMEWSTRAIGRMTKPKVLDKSSILMGIYLKAFLTKGNL